MKTLNFIIRKASFLLISFRQKLCRDEREMPAPSIFQTLAIPTGLGWKGYAKYRKISPDYNVMMRYK